ncbi:MAG: glycosyltransferase family 39 protein [Elusimicrobia bacterium]|nr:glycosyltransferase family 39 protein [Elusimicrobiota bacterium]
MTALPVKRIAIGAACAAALALQFASYVFDGDSAVAGLMALHISQLKEFPLYFWANHYAGTLSSYMAAAFFLLFGVSSTASALPGILIAWIWILSQYALARRVLSPAGALAALLLCLFPPMNVLWYTILNAGVYAETFAFSSVLFLFAAYRASSRPARPGLFYFLAGAAAGFGQWLSPGMLPAAGAALFFFAVSEKRLFFGNCLPFFAAGFAAGFAPALAHTLLHPRDVAFRMGGRLLDLDRNFLGEPDKAAAITKLIWRKIISGPLNLFKLPLSYVRSVGLLNLALFTAAAAVAVKEAAGRIRERTFPAPVDVALVYAAFFAAFYAFLLSAPQADRYAVPLYAAAPLFLGRAFELLYGRRKKLAAVVLAAAVGANIFSVAAALGKKPRYDHGLLAAHLERSGVKHAFSDYATAYMVTFLTKEKVVASPTLYHADFADRYPDYTRQARNSAEPAFIINTVLFPGREELALARLGELKVSFRKESLGGFTVLSGLSRRVYPEELGLRPAD